MNIIVSNNKVTLLEKFGKEEVGVSIEVKNMEVGFFERLLAAAKTAVYRNMLEDEKYKKAIKKVK